MNCEKLYLVRRSASSASWALVSSVCRRSNSPWPIRATAGPPPVADRRPGHARCQRCDERPGSRQGPAKLGASVTLIPGGEIFQALEKGAIDASEFSMPAIDQSLGFDRVAKIDYFPAGTAGRPPIPAPPAAASRRPLAPARPDHPGDRLRDVLIWLVLIAVIMLNVTMRYAFGQGRIEFEEILLLRTPSPTSVASSMRPVSYA